MHLILYLDTWIKNDWQIQYLNVYGLAVDSSYAHCAPERWNSKPHENCGTLVIDSALVSLHGFAPWKCGSTVRNWRNTAHDWSWLHSADFVPLKYIFLCSMERNFQNAQLALINHKSLPVDHSLDPSEAFVIGSYCASASFAPWDIGN